MIGECLVTDIAMVWLASFRINICLGAGRVSDSAAAFDGMGPREA